MYDIFLSYRRDGGHEMARLLYEHLRLKGLNCFFDLEELGSGQFNEKLLDSIEESKNFVLVLSPNALERCQNEGDWVRCEIEHAIKCEKNIVPLMLPGFEWPEELPESLAKLPLYNGVQLVREYFDASIEKLIAMLKLDDKPEDTTLQEQTYQAAVLGMKTAKKKKQFEKLAEIFISLGLYKDSVEKTKECYALAQKVVRRRRLKIFIAACVILFAASAAVGTWAYKQAQEDDKQSQEDDKQEQNNPHTHTFGDWVVDEEATCVSEGTRHHVCTVCNRSVSESIPVEPTAHNYFASWTTDGTNHWHKCKNSGCNSIIDKAGHSFGEWVIDVVDSCMQAGVRHHVCSICDKSVSENYIDLSAHNYTTAWITSDTHHWHFCQNSGCTSVADKTPHTFGEWIIDEAATCTTSGTRHHVCTTCNKSVSETISATGHNYSTTWSTDGTNHWRVCQNSGCTSVSGKTTHTFGQWIVDKAATCTTSGTRHHVCTTCNKSVSETVPVEPTAHNYSTSWTTDDTYHWHACQNSGCTSVSDKTSHTWSQGYICTECQYSCLEFTEQADGTYSVSKYRGRASEVIVPSTYNGLAVTSIGERAFDDCTSLTSITIPSSVTSIGEYAFYGCTGLEAVYICDMTAWLNISFSVHDFEHNYSNPLCYAGNLYLDGELVTDLVIPESMTTIKSGSFCGCTSLTSITFGENSQLKGINSFAFAYSGLTSITIPDGVKYIDRFAFNNCHDLTSVTFPYTLEQIWEEAFLGCTSLTSITFGEGSQLNLIDFEAFEYCTNLTSINFGGTTSQWYRVTKLSWNYNTPTITVYCTDGTVTEKYSY